MDVRGRAKEFLTQQANVRLAQLGHSPPMVRDAKREAWWWLQARGQALERRSRLLSGSAVVWTAPGLTELVRVEVPRAGGGEITVMVLTSVVSTGTERAQYLSLPNTSVGFPHRPGYSAAGVVLATGRDVSGVKPEDLVAVRNVPHMSVVTAPAKSVHPVPAGVGEEAAAMVQFGVICGQGVRRAGIEKGDAVCVIGAGLIGLLSQRLAKAAGAGETTVVARSRAKERIATGGGARFLEAEADADGDSDTCCSGRHRGDRRSRCSSAGGRGGESRRPPRPARLASGCDFRGPSLGDPIQAPSRHRGAHRHAGIRVRPFRRRHVRA